MFWIYRYSRYARPHLFFLTLFILTYTGTAFAERLAVSVSNANIRSGPGVQYKKLWDVNKFHPIIVLDKKGEWYQFRDFEGDSGWIHRSLVKEIPSVITAKDDCNVRNGPGIRFKVVFVAERRVPLKVIKKQNSWIKVEHADGDTGWIHESLVW